MAWLLNIVYLLVLLLASPWLAWSAIRKRKYRSGWRAKLLGSVPRREGDATCLWLHAVSVGEVNLLVPLVEELARRHPDWVYVISTTTKTGMEVARKRFPNRSVFYAPLDFSWAVRNAMRRVRPDLLVLAELELWPNWIRAAQNAGAKVAVVNGRLSDRSTQGYARLGKLTKKLFGKLDLVAAQHEVYASRFEDLGVPPTAVRVTGSIKFDGVETNRNNPRSCELRKLAKLPNDARVFLAGSTQDPEEEYALKAFLALRGEVPQARLILVPRHPERFEEVARVISMSGLHCIRRSVLDSEPSADDAWDILLVDVMGELGAWWALADVGFVGGSFGQRGGQNMLEPTAYGVPTCFGPNTWNFRDVVRLLLGAGAAVELATPADMKFFLRRCFLDEEFAAQLGARSAALVRSQQGATRLTVDLLESAIQAAAEAPSSRTTHPSTAA